MKTRHNPCLCPNCEDKIVSYGYPCIILMDLVTAYFLKSVSLTFNDRDNHDRQFKLPLEFLEKKGFLVSTEVDESDIQILPNFSKCDFDRHKSRFCWC